jgi:hypothetical protein
VIIFNDTCIKMKQLKNKILPGLTIIICTLSCNQSKQQTPQTKSAASLFTVSKEIPIWIKSIPDSDLVKAQKFIMTE